MNLLFYLQLSVRQRWTISLTFSMLFLFFCYHARFIHAFEALHQAEKNNHANQKIFHTQYQLIQQTARITIKIKILQAMQTKKNASEIFLENAQQNHIADTQLSSESKKTLIVHFSAPWNDVTHLLQTMTKTTAPIALQQITLQTHDDTDRLFTEMHMNLAINNTEDIAKSYENKYVSSKTKNPFHHDASEITEDPAPLSPEHFLWRGYLLQKNEAMAFYQNADGLMTAVKKGDAVTPGDWSVVRVQPDEVVLKNTEGKVLRIPLRD